MGNKRKGVGKRLRFEVFKRDRFTCQYCGKQAPNVVLRVDHVRPVAEGGTNELLNLVTACEDCNAGKGAILLADDSVLIKQRAQLEALAERREQIDMMLEWSRELGNQRDYELDEVCKRIEGAIPDRCLSEKGRIDVKKWLRQYSLVQIIGAAEISASQYLRPMKSGGFETDSIDRYIAAIPGIARVRALPQDEKDLLYIRGIIRNRFDYCNEGRAMELLRKAARDGHSIERLKDISRAERNWTGWVRAMEELEPK